MSSLNSTEALTSTLQELIGVLNRLVGELQRQSSAPAMAAPTSARPSLTMTAEDGHTIAGLSVLEASQPGMGAEPAAEFRGSATGDPILEYTVRAIRAPLERGDDIVGRAGQQGSSS